MPKINLLFYAATLLVAINLVSCVPARKFQDEQARARTLSAQYQSCQEQLEVTQAEEERLRTALASSNETIDALRRDTTEVGRKYRQTMELNKNLNELYEKVIAQNKDLLSSSTSERQRLSEELVNKERMLQQKENQLNQKEVNINSLQSNLQEREARVKELEELINRKDSTVNALRQNISRALLSFDESQLTVQVKDGKVYVSLSEQLLFKSGSVTVDPAGRDALNKVAAVLKQQPDIDIMIEGHTDNVPMRSAAIRDNWDLSVLRATSIVRILTDNGIEPARVIPTGRGEFVPVADNQTREGKAQNRRTEIILSPKLDAIFKIIDGN